MTTPLVETSSSTAILSPRIEDQINSFVWSDTEKDNNNSLEILEVIDNAYKHAKYKKIKHALLPEIKNDEGWINSIRNKFESLVRFVGNNLDILMVSETKIDDTFLKSQFLIEGFSKPFRLDRIAKGGRILLYIREDIPCRNIKQITLNNLFEGFFVELNLKSRKCVLGSSYNPHKENITSHLSNVSTALDKLCSDDENIILLGDFNVEVKEKNISDFMSPYNLKSLVK